MVEEQRARVVVQRRVEWPDTDAAGHYHHSTVVRWVESAETVLHERLSLVELMGFVPRVSYQVDYCDRLYYRDIVDVELRVVEVRRSSARFEFEVRRAGELAAAGSIVVVHVDRESGSSAPWPDHARTLLLEAGPQSPELITGAESG